MKKFFVLIACFFVLFSFLWTVDRLPKLCEDCPFCQERVIRRQIFYQGKEVLGIATHQPAVKGHVLIIPSRHVERFDELKPSEMSEIGNVVEKVNRAVSHLYGTTGYILLQKNGREAGQSVPHVHFHYIPVQKNGSRIVVFFKLLFASLLSAKGEMEMAPEIAALSKQISSTDF